jgi:adenylosuccinate lyase
MKAWREDKDFAALLKADPDVHGKLSDKEIAASVDLKYHLKHVDTIFRRVFGKSR